MRSLLTVVWMLMSFAVLADALPGEPYVAVTGTHSEKVVPDRVRLSLSLIETGRDVAAATASVDGRASQLIRAVKALGVAAQDISSSNLRITPHHNWHNQEQVYVGTEVARDVEIVLRDIALYDELLKALLDAKVGRINDTVLETSQQEALRARALRGAVQDARARARMLVQDLPQTIGRVYSISSLSGEPVTMTRQLAHAGLAEATAFEPGVIEIRESVQVVFYLTGQQ